MTQPLSLANWQAPNQTITATFEALIDLRMVELIPDEGDSLIFWLAPNARIDAAGLDEPVTITTDDQGRVLTLEVAA